MRVKLYCNPSPYIRVDESMVGYNKWFCSFKQYMLLKPITHGIKLRRLTCFCTSYLLNLEVHVGAANEALANHPQHEYESGAGVVTRLTERMENQGYTCAMDNFFSGPALFEDVLSKVFYALEL